MTIIHSALFWLRKDLTTTERAHFEQELRKLAALPYLAQGHVGPAAATPARSVVDNSFDHATSLHFKSLADHEHYQTQCPLHAQFVASCSGYWERVVVHDFAPLG